MSRSSTDQLIARFNEINRTRALTDREVDLLDAAIKREKQCMARRGEVPPIKPGWTYEQDERLRRLINAGHGPRSAARIMGKSEASIFGRLKLMPNPPHRYAR